MRVKDKVIIVTGAGQGLGAAYARKLAEEGARVIVADVNEEKGRSVAEEITGKGHEALAIMTDVSWEESTRDLARSVMEKYGRVDVLINNAGIVSTIKLKATEEITVEEWDQLMGVNLRGVFLCCKAVIPYMKAQKRGKIINISSSTVFKGKPHYIHYVTSKAGIIGFTRALAKELGEYNIRVNCVAPGYLKTEISRETTSIERQKAILNNQCVKRFGEPADILGLILYLASEESDFMSGQTLNIDGGDNLR